MFVRNTQQGKIMSCYLLPCRTGTKQQAEAQQSGYLHSSLLLLEDTWVGAVLLYGIPISMGSLQLSWCCLVEEQGV